MKKRSSCLAIKTLLVAGLLAATSLAFNATAQNSDTHWSPFNVLDDGNGPYAYFADPANWDSAVVPGYTNSNGGTVRTMVSQADGFHVTCVITNDQELFQIMAGAGNGGDVVVTNGASVKTGLGTYGGGIQWTGVGFPDGPSTLNIGPGASFTCGDHLWIGQGTGNEGSVIVNGGTLRVHGQLGAGWNGTGGTNYVTIANGGKILLNSWAGQTLGNGSSVGIMNLASNNCFVIVTNNQTGFFPGLVTAGKLLAYGGAGTVTWSYNPVANITTVGALPPTNAFTPVITVQPTNVVTSLGKTVSFHVTVATPPAAVNYQWLFNGNPLSNGGAISGATSADLTVTGVTAANIGSYAVKITSSVQADQIATSVTVGLSTAGINLYPVITILGVPGNTYVTSSSTTVNGTYTPFATNTLNSFAPFYLVDTTTPMSVTKFYKTVQQ